jgi:hypothetical protein
MLIRTLLLASAIALPPLSGLAADPASIADHAAAVKRSAKCGVSRYDGISDQIAFERKK